MGKSCYRKPSIFLAVTMKINVHVLLSQYAKKHVKGSHTSKLTCPPDYWVLVVNNWAAESGACRQPLMVHLLPARVSCDTSSSHELAKAWMLWRYVERNGIWLCGPPSMWFNQWELWIPQCMIAFKIYQLSVCSASPCVLKHFILLLSSSKSFNTSVSTEPVPSYCCFRKEDRRHFPRHYSQNLIKSIIVISTERLELLI